MRIEPLLIAMAALPGLASGAPAQDALPGLYFAHGDWELACDNTGTCRAAGYQSEQQLPAVAVLLTRKAGPAQAVHGQLLLGEAPDGAAPVPKQFTLTLRIDGRNSATVPAGAGPLPLPPAATRALLGALPRTATLEWRAGPLRWQLSGKGAAAVLLKMDAFQGRVGTRGALISPGKASEQAVRRAAPVPVVTAVPWAAAQADDAPRMHAHTMALRQALRATLGEQDYCPVLLDGDAEPLSVQRLDARRLLVSTRCWSGAYNVSEGYWVIDASPPFHPVLVTTSGSETDPPHILESHKGRGIGDCRWRTVRTWNGREFVQTASLSTGLCKMVAAGGAWELPRIVSDVRSPRP